MLWRLRTKTLDLAREGVLMGVLNVTPDSFSDGGSWRDPEDAAARARTMARLGAQIIDVGGESTRPGATPVPEDEEMARVLPVIERLAAENGPILSVDTYKPAVARAAVERGAEIVNDVTGLRDPAMRAVVSDLGAGAVVMHMQGDPRSMQHRPTYRDPVSEIHDFFRQQLDASVRSGIDPMRLAFDPGIGFGKTDNQNLALLREIASVAIAGRPTVVGVSRKSFIGRLLGSGAIEDRAWPTVALTSLLREYGARVFRVHDIQPNFEALRMTEAILNIRS